MALELTRLSRKGQVVIPTEVRRKMGCGATAADMSGNFEDPELNKVDDVIF
jgi:hypothetical protein